MTGLRLVEHRLRGRRRQPRLEARQGRGAGDHRPRRGGSAQAAPSSAAASAGTTPPKASASRLRCRRRVSAACNAAAGRSSLLALVAGDQRRHPVLGVSGRVEVRGVHQDREGDGAVPGIAVARQRADRRSGCRSWSGSARRPRCRSCGRRPSPARRPAGASAGRRAGSGSPVHRGQQPDDLAWGGAIGSREPGAVLHLDARVPTRWANLLTLRAPRRVVPLGPARPRREALQQHLGEEVVRGPEGRGDQARHRGRAHASERRACGATRAGRSARPIPPSTLTPILRSLCFSALAATSSGFPA